jgi:DNA-binding response OmpR family regulator
MRIVIAEDDRIQADQYVGDLSEAFREAAFILFRTEKEFRDGLESIAMHPPDIVILDIMLRWTDPSLDHHAAPPDVKAGKFHHAGFRCLELLRRGDKTREVPVILYTVVDSAEFKPEVSTLPSNVRMLPKMKTLYNVIAAIREMTGEAKRLQAGNQ